MVYSLPLSVVQTVGSSEWMIVNNKFEKDLDRIGL
jgi:hypothetical protein